MRRLLVVAGILILLGAIGAAYCESTHRFGGSVRGTSTEFERTQTVPAPKAGPLVSPMFGGQPQHLHVGVGKVRPPFRRDWVTGGTSLVEFPPAIAFHYLYYASLNGNLIAVSTRNGRRLWTIHVGRCEAAAPAVNRLEGGSVFETFLNHVPCRRGSAARGARRGPRGRGGTGARRALDASASVRPRRRRPSSATGSTSATTPATSTACATATARRSGRSMPAGP